MISCEEPTMCDLCGSGNIVIIKREPVEKNDAALEENYYESNRIFIKAYRKAFGEKI